MRQRYQTTTSLLKFESAALFNDATFECLQARDELSVPGRNKVSWRRGNMVGGLANVPFATDTLGNAQ